MRKDALHDLLGALQDDRISLEEAATRLQGLIKRTDELVDLDTDRPRRTGHPEVIYGQGKRAEDIIEILGQLHAAEQTALATRVDQEKAERVLAALPEVIWHDRARVLEYRSENPGPDGKVRGRIAIVCAGTSDLPVAEEAAVIAEAFGNPVDRYWDVGVAGIHRVLRHVEALQAATVVIVVAGMEGALASVVAGLVSGPVVAVPTSVGYGASFGGVAALLGMLNSCAPGVSVVNIDNGFGAAVQASRFNRAPDQ